MVAVSATGAAGSAAVAPTSSLVLAAYFAVAMPFAVAQLVSAVLLPRTCLVSSYPFAR